MSDGRKWTAIAEKGHSVLGGATEFVYYSDDAPVEANEYARMWAERDEARAEVEALRARLLLTEESLRATTTRADEQEQRAEKAEAMLQTWATNFEHIEDAEDAWYTADLFRQAVATLPTPEAQP